MISDATAQRMPVCGADMSSQCCHLRLHALCSLLTLPSSSTSSSYISAGRVALLHAATLRDQLAAQQELHRTR